MPYRQTNQGKMEFSGKIADWMRDFQKWYTQDCGNNAQIPFLTYAQYITLFYSGLAKAKWQDGFFSKSKAKTLDNFVTKTPKGNISVDIYANLDFLAENLSSEERNQWSQHCRNEFLKIFKK